LTAWYLYFLLIYVILTSRTPHATYTRNIKV